MIHTFESVFYMNAVDGNESIVSEKVLCLLYTLNSISTRCSPFDIEHMS
jgi:hypothetical protein